MGQKGVDITQFEKLNELKHSEIIQLFRIYT